MARTKQTKRIREGTGEKSPSSSPPSSPSSPKKRKVSVIQSVAELSEEQRLDYGKKLYIDHVEDVLRLKLHGNLLLEYQQEFSRQIEHFSSVPILSCEMFAVLSAFEVLKKHTSINMKSYHADICQDCKSLHFKEDQKDFETPNNYCEECLKEEGEDDHDDNNAASQYFSKYERPM